MPVDLAQQSPVLLWRQLDHLPIHALESLHRSIRIVRVFQDLVIQLFHQARRY